MQKRSRRRSDRAGRPAMRSPGRPPVAGREAQQRFWTVIARGLSSEEARGEQVLVPAGLEREFVVGEDVGALLVLGHVVEPQTEHLGHAEPLCRGHAPVAGQDRSRLVDQHRVGEAELLDAGRAASDPIATGDSPDTLCARSTSTERSAPLR